VTDAGRTPLRGDDGQPAIAVAVAVVTRGGSVLVGRRPDGAAESPGCAEFPGGKVQAGESREAAARRECLEETGIAIIITGECGRVHAATAGPPIDLTFFTATPCEPTRHPRPPFRWVARHELASLPFPPANAGVVAGLVARPRDGAHGGS